MNRVLIGFKRIDMIDRKVILEALSRFSQKGKDDLGRDIMYIKMENAGDLADRLVLNLSKHNVSEILSYEIRSSWWASKLSNKYLQNLAGSYFAWKVRRKHNRLIINSHWKKVLKSSR